MANEQILVVEDELLVAKNLQYRLKRLGYDVPTIISSGEEAVKKVEQIRPYPGYESISKKREIQKRVFS